MRKKRLNHYHNRRKRFAHRKRVDMRILFQKLEKNPELLNEREIKELVKMIRRFNMIWYAKTLLYYYSKQYENKGYG